MGTLNIPTLETTYPVLIERPTAAVVVKRTNTGWHIEGHSKRVEPIGGNGIFTAEITECRCKRESCACGLAVGSGACKNLCHGWHAGRVLKLVQRLAESYS